MTATAIPRLTPTIGDYPRKMTLPMAANERIVKGTIVCINASGQAVAGVAGEGFAAMGRAASNFDNTTAATGGAAGAINCEVECGCWGWLETGTDPVIGDVVYVQDNQTIGTDSDSGANGIAGYVVDIDSDTSTYYVSMGPHIAGQIVIAASEASQLDTAQAEIQAIEDHLLNAGTCIEIPITSWRLATGAAIPAYSDGTDGLTLQDSEAVGIRLNDGVHTSLMNQVGLPNELDDGEDVVFHALGFRIGAADEPALTIGAFFQTVGAAHTADDDCGGDTTTFAAATTVVSEETVTIDAADVPAAPNSLSLTMASNADLDADDLVIVRTWLEYTPQLLT